MLWYFSYTLLKIFKLTLWLEISSSSSIFLFEYLHVDINLLDEFIIPLELKNLLSSNTPSLISSLIASLKIKSVRYVEISEAFTRSSIVQIFTSHSTDCSFKNLFLIFLISFLFGKIKIKSVLPFLIWFFK